MPLSPCARPSPFSDTHHLLHLHDPTCGPFRTHQGPEIWRAKEAVLGSSSLQDSRRSFAKSRPTAVARSFARSGRGSDRMSRYSRSTSQEPLMTEIRARVLVGPDRRISGTAPADVPPGEHEVTI